MNKKGFSLAEMLAVVVIMGIIATISIVLIGNTIENTKKKQIYSDAVTISEAARLYCIVNDKDDFCKGKADLDDNRLAPFISNSKYHVVNSLTRMISDPYAYFVKINRAGAIYVEAQNDKYVYKGDPLIHKATSGCYIDKISDAFCVTSTARSYEDLINVVSSYCLPSEVFKPEDKPVKPGPEDKPSPEEKPSPDVKPEVPDKKPSINDHIYDDPKLEQTKPKFEVETDSSGKITNVVVKPSVSVDGNVNLGKDGKPLPIEKDHFQKNPGLKDVPNISFSDLPNPHDDDPYQTVIKDGSGMFKGFDKLEVVDFGNDDDKGLEEIDEEWASKTDEMFKDCTNLKTVIGMPKFEDVVSSNSMFENCYNLENLDIEEFEKIDSANRMFKNCKSLKQVNLSEVGEKDPLNLKSASMMFDGCSSLEKLDLRNVVNIDQSNLESCTKNMLRGTLSLKEITISNLSLKYSGIDIAKGWTYYDAKLKKNITIHNIDDFEAPKGVIRTFKKII